MATETNKYLSLSGLATFWDKVKAYVNNIDVTITGDVESTDWLAISKSTTDVTATGTKKFTFTVDSSVLDTKIAALDQKDNDLTQAISDEKSRAELAEKTLTDNLAKEVTDRTTAVGNLKTELLGDAADDYNTLGKLEDKVQTVDAKLDAAIGQGGNVATQITNAINALDVTDAAVDGEYVSSVSETDGKISVSRTVLPTYNVSATGAFVTVTPTDLDNKGKAFAITTSDIASDTDLQTTKGRVTTLEGKVDALASATHFRGVVTSLDSVENPAEGDVVVLNGTLEGDAFSKEYIWSNGAWIELGDTTAELQAIDKNAKAIEAEAAARAKADEDLEAELRQAIADAITNDKTSVTDDSDLVDISIDAAGKVITLSDTDKLTHAVAIAETSVQKVEGVTGTYADIVVTETVNTGDDSTKSYKVAADFHTADTVQGGEEKLTTAAKVKAYVEAKLNSVAHEGQTGDADLVKVVTSVTNRTDGTGFDVNFTNFEAISDSDIDGLFV